MSKHTPGPWVAVLDVSSGRVELEEQTGTRFTPSSADLNLLAAAPEMLEALQILVKAVNVEALDPLIVFASVEKARAAIAKATGT